MQEQDLQKCIPNHFWRVLINSASNAAVYCYSLFIEMISLDEDDVDDTATPPIDIRTLHMNLKKALSDDQDEDELVAAPKSPTLGRYGSFPEEARPPTPPNASHRVRTVSPPRTPPSTPSQQ